MLSIYTYSRKGETSAVICSPVSCQLSVFGSGLVSTTSREKNLTLYLLNAQLCSPAGGLLCLSVGVLPNIVWHIDGSAHFLIGNSCLLRLETRLIRAVILNQSGKVLSHETKSWQMLKCKVELMGTTESSDDFLYFQITLSHVYFSLGALNLSLCKWKSWFIQTNTVQCYSKSRSWDFRLIWYIRG